MAKFSRQIEIFLEKVEADPERHVAMVPKSDSCASPGDVLFFKYSLEGTRSARLFLITEPITRIAGTGNLLMTGFKIPEDGDYTPESLQTLYKNKELPRENYRTYIMSRIWGPLRRIRKEA